MQTSRNTQYKWEPGDNFQLFLYILGTNLWHTLKAGSCSFQLTAAAKLLYLTVKNTNIVLTLRYVVISFEEMYLRDIKNGVTQPKGEPSIEKNIAATALVNGNDLLGPVWRF